MQSITMDAFSQFAFLACPSARELCKDLALSSGSYTHSYHAFKVQLGIKGKFSFNQIICFHQLSPLSRVDHRIDMSVFVSVCIYIFSVLDKKYIQNGISWILPLVFPALSNCRRASYSSMEPHLSLFLFVCLL